METTSPNDAPAESFELLDGFPLSLRIVSRLAEHLDTTPVSIDPLYHSVDPEALDSLCNHARDRDEPVDISFEHADRRVNVTIDEDVSISVIEP